MRWSNVVALGIVVAGLAWIGDASLAFGVSFIWGIGYLILRIFQLLKELGE